MIIESIISYGFLDLMEIFFKANSLNVKCMPREQELTTLITFEYNDDSDTALAITVMSLKHLGFENMLIDYLLRCGYSSDVISIIKIVPAEILDFILQSVLV